MVLYLNSMMQVLDRHVVLLEVVSDVFARWGFDSPFAAEEIGNIREARNQVRALLDDGVTEVRIPEKSG